MTGNNQSDEGTALGNLFGDWVLVSFTYYNTDFLGTDQCRNQTAVEMKHSNFVRERLHTPAILHVFLILFQELDI